MWYANLVIMYVLQRKQTTNTRLHGWFQDNFFSASGIILILTTT